MQSRSSHVRVVHAERTAHLTCQKRPQVTVVHPLTLCARLVDRAKDALVASTTTNNGNACAVLHGIVAAGKQMCTHCNARVPGVDVCLRAAGVAFYAHKPPRIRHSETRRRIRNQDYQSVNPIRLT